MRPFQTLATSLALLYCLGECQVEEDQDDGAADFYNTKEVELDATKHDSDFFTFVTRPDIDAPKWDIKVHDKSAVAPGFWFISPYGLVHQRSTDHAYVAPHIYDSDGELVWSGVELFKKINMFTFKVSKLGPQMENQLAMTVLNFRANEGYIVDRSYKIMKTIHTGVPGEWGRNMHEFQLVDKGTKALYLTSHTSKSMENAATVNYTEGGCRLAYQRIEERDVGTQEITFEWSMLGNIGPEESYLYENEPSELCSKPVIPGGPTADLHHANAVEKTPRGDYLLSARHTDAIYMISKEGKLLWRLGGRKNDFTMDKDLHFSGQHDVRCLKQNSTHMTITLFDNAHRYGWPAFTNSWSRGLVLSLDTVHKTAKISHVYPHPDKGYAMERGNFQTLPNGNALLFWTNSSLNSEHTPDGTVVKTARLRSGLATYRGYKFEWEGRPTERPKIHSQLAQIDGELVTVVHVSWNGATRVTSWNLMQTDQWNGNRTHLLGASRTGFETALVYRGQAKHVLVEAVDRLGRTIRESDPFETLPNFGNMSSEALEVALERSRIYAEGSGVPLPVDADDHSKGGTSTSVVFAGVLFCALAVLFARTARKMLSSWVQRRKRSPYSSLDEKEIDEATVALRDRVY